MEKATPRIAAEPATSRESLEPVAVERLAPLKFKIKLKVSASSAPKAPTVHVLAPPSAAREVVHEVVHEAASPPPLTALENLRSISSVPREVPNLFESNLSSGLSTMHQHLEDSKTPRHAASDEEWVGSVFNFDGHAGVSSLRSSPGSESGYQVQVPSI